MTGTRPETINRELSLEGSVNFRDLGGLLTTDNRRTRAGRLFRSDALHRLTNADLDILSELRIATLIDLRSQSELERSGPSPLLDRGTRHLHLPLFSSDTSPAAIDPALTLGDLYVSMLERGTDRIRMIFEILADGRDLPAVVHCAAGKDRTGVVTALILRSIGIADITIVEDYALTDRNMMRLIEQMQASGQPLSGMRVPDHYMRAVPETMELFLKTVDDTYGSTSGYLTHAGVDAPVIAAVRDQLLQPAG
jgi:protein tyrosine/serine phosphatase